MNPTKNEVLKR